MMKESNPDDLTYCDACDTNVSNKCHNPVNCVKYRNYLINKNL